MKFELNFNESDVRHEIETQSATELLGFVLPHSQNEFDDPKEFINSVCQELAINTGVNFSLAFLPTNH